MHLLITTWVLPWTSTTDLELFTAMLTQILTDLGYTNIVTFSNGADCIKNLDQNPALIFLDYQMEHMDGLKVLPKIKNYNALPIELAGTYWHFVDVLWIYLFIFYNWIG